MEPLPTPAAAPADALAGLIARTEALLDQGLCLQAFAHFATLKADPSPPAQVVAARVMRQVGADRAGEALAVRTWRAHRNDPLARIGMLRQLVYRSSPYRGWQWLERLRLADDAPVALRAEFLGVEAYLWAALRDFDAAQRCFDAACALDDQQPWLWTEWAYALERADRYDDAAAALERAFALHPGFRGAIHHKAHLLTLGGDDPGALALLREAFARMESGDMGAQLFDLLYEHEAHDEAAAVLDRIETLRPLADTANRRWLAARRADLALRRDDMAAAATQAALADSPFYRPIAERLRADPPPAQRRVILPVGFVRQHWQTCGPATLTALARYWQRDADHLAIAGAICYDGTSHLAERRWAAEAGFVAREFTLDWASARALLDAGIPFTLTTTFTTSGHLQAVIGYDLLRNSLLIRDPGMRAHGEFEVDSLLAAQKAYGPRAMLMVPPEAAQRLQGIALPDAELWDHYHAMAEALDKHDRVAAQAATDALLQAAPAHRLAHGAQRALALYDADETRILATTEALLALYPDDANLQLSKSASLWAIGGRGEQFAWLDSLARRPAPDAIVLTRLADRLSEDSRRLDEAFKVLARAFRRAPLDAAVWQQRASLLWAAGRQDEALGCYRISACLQEVNEHYAAAYMRACHLVRQSETGLDFLRRRVMRLGDRSSAPARTLFEQLDALERTEEAFAVLDDALARHPDDADLLIFCAEARLRYGQPEHAAALLDRIGPAVRAAAVLGTRALAADAAGRLEQALACAREASALDPLDLRRHRHVASLLSRLQGRQAAVAWLREASARFPHNPGLSRTLYDWLEGAAPQEQEAVLRQMAAAHPGDAWVLRELANHLTRERRFDQARACAEEAVSRAGWQSDSHCSLAYLALREHGYAAAVPHLRRALALNIDDGYALDTLVEASPTLEARQAALAFIWDELLRQVTVGDGLLNYQLAARRSMAPEELLERLRYALQERPDLWHAWVAVATQLCDMHRADEAMPVIAEAASRFPRLPRLHLEHARAHSLLGQREKALDCIASALDISPAWGRAVRQYVDTVCETGQDLRRAERVLRHALSRGAENADLRGLLGWLLEQMGRHDEAIAAVLASLKLDPAPSWVWETARRLFAATGREGELQGLVDEVVQARPGDPAVWAVKAELASTPEAACAAAQQALQIDPRHLRGWLAWLDALLRARHYDEIDAALARTPWGEDTPPELRAFGPRTLRARGRHDAARDAMRTLIAADPNRYGYWRELADWDDADDRHADYEAAAAQMVRLAPTHAVAYGYLGHARLKAGRGPEALEAFVQAVRLDPAYAFAALHATELGLEHERLDAASLAAEAHAPHCNNPRMAALRTRVAARRGEAGIAREAARDTLRLSAAHGGRYSQGAVRALAEAGWRDAADSLVRTEIAGGRCPTDAVEAWLDMIAAGRSHEALYEHVKPLFLRDGGHALKRGMLCFAGRQRSAHLLHRVLGAHGKAVRSDGECWGLVGWVHVQFDAWHAVVHWQRDWPSRSERPGWALENLALAHGNLGDLAAAGVVADALAEAEPDNMSARLWAGSAAAHAGHTELALERLSGLDREALPDYLSALDALMQAWAAAQQQGDARTARDAFRQAGAAARTLPALKALRRALAWPLCRSEPWWRRPLTAAQLMWG